MRPWSEVQRPCVIAVCWTEVSLKDDRTQATFSSCKQLAFIIFIVSSLPTRCKPDQVAHLPESRRISSAWLKHLFGYRGCTHERTPVCRSPGSGYNSVQLQPSSFQKPQQVNAWRPSLKVIFSRSRHQIMKVLQTPARSDLLARCPAGWE